MSTSTTPDQAQADLHPGLGDFATLPFEVRLEIYKECIKSGCLGLLHASKTLRTEHETSQDSLLDKYGICHVTINDGNDDSQHRLRRIIETPGKNIHRFKFIISLARCPNEYHYSCRLGVAFNGMFQDMCISSRVADSPDCHFVIDCTRAGAYLYDEFGAFACELQRQTKFNKIVLELVNLDMKVEIMSHNIKGNVPFVVRGHLEPWHGKAEGDDEYMVFHTQAHVKEIGRDNLPPFMNHHYECG